MQLSIYLTIAYVAIAAAKQLNVGPQIFSDAQSPSSSSQNLGKRYVTQEYTLYLSPEEVKALQGIKSSDAESQYNKESQVRQEKEEERQLEWYNSQFIPEVPQLEIRGIAGYDTFFQKQKPKLETQEGNKYRNIYSEDKPIQQTKETSEISNENLENYYHWRKEQENRESEVKTQQKSKLENDAKWNEYITELAEKHENIKLNEQLKQQWNRILEHNRAQLKSFSPLPKESQELKESKTSVEQGSSKNVIEKAVQNILKDQRGYELRKQSGISQTDIINQKLPILIHQEVSVTKHLPVPFVKKVKVPTPVLVPVPEPYEVKIPHPYPVPQKVFKHIPLPLVRNY